MSIEAIFKNMFSDKRRYIFESLTRCIFEIRRSLLFDFNDKNEFA